MKIIINLHNGEQLNEEADNYTLKFYNENRFTWYNASYGQSIELSDAKNIQIILENGKRIIEIKFN